MENKAVRKKHVLSKGPSKETFDKFDSSQVNWHTACCVQLFLNFWCLPFPIEAMEGESSRPRKKQRTGPRKRIQAADARDSARPAPSQLAAKLLKDWAWGRISIQYAQELAHKAVADMQPFECNLAGLQFLAGLGTAGKFPNNMHRDVMKYINSPLPKLFPVPRLQLRTQLPNNFSNKPTSIPLRQKFLSKAT